MGGSAKKFFTRPYTSYKKARDEDKKNFFQALWQAIKPGTVPGSVALAGVTLAGAAAVGTAYKCATNSGKKSLLGSVFGADGDSYLTPTNVAVGTAATAGLGY